MTIYYTANPVVAFYVSEFTKTIPEGAKEISREAYDALLEAQGKGKQIVADGDQLIATDRPPAEPKPVTQISPLEFFARFTEDEEEALGSAAMQTPKLFLWLTKASAATYIDLTSDLTRAGLQALVDAGIITDDRALEILKVNMV